jgi:ABC-type sugar transport system permease subunit
MQSSSVNDDKRSIETRYKRWIGLILIAPWLIGFIIFKLVPILSSLVISFTDFFLIAPDKTQYVGLNNYLFVLTDVRARTVLAETIKLAAIIIPLQTFTAIFIASLLSSKDLLLKDTVRTLFFLPSIIPGFAAALMWEGFVNPSMGWMNRILLDPIGLGSLNHFSSFGGSESLFILSSLWTLGPSILIMMSSMQSIHPEIYEASKIDGANRFVRFFRMTIPLITPAIFFSLILNLTAVFGGGILLDRGNTFRGANFTSYDGYTHYVLFDQFQLGYAASLAWVFFIVVMIVILIMFGTSKRWVYFPDREN